MTKTAKAWGRFLAMSDESDALLDALLRLTFAFCDSTDPAVRVALSREIARVRKALHEARARRDEAWSAANAASSR